MESFIERFSKLSSCKFLQLLMFYGALLQVLYFMKTWQSPASWLSQQKLQCSHSYANQIITYKEITNRISYQTLTGALEHTQNNFTVAYKFTPATGTSHQVGAISLIHSWQIRLDFRVDLTLNPDQNPG